MGRDAAGRPIQLVLDPEDFLRPIRLRRAAADRLRRRPDTKVPPDAGRLLALEIALHGGDRFGHRGCSMPGSARASGERPARPPRRFLVGSRSSLAPLFQAMPPKPARSRRSDTVRVDIDAFRGHWLLGIGRRVRRREGRLTRSRGQARVPARWSGRGRRRVTPCRRSRNQLAAEGRRQRCEGIEGRHVRVAENGGGWWSGS